MGRASSRLLFKEFSNKIVNLKQKIYYFFFCLWGTLQLNFLGYGPPLSQLGSGWTCPFHYRDTNGFGLRASLFLDPTPSVLHTQCLPLANLIDRRESEAVGGCRLQLAQVTLLALSSVHFLPGTAGVLPALQGIVCDRRPVVLHSGPAQL